MLLSVLAPGASPPRAVQTATMAWPVTDRVPSGRAGRRRPSVRSHCASSVAGAQAPARRRNDSTASGPADRHCAALKKRPMGRTTSGRARSSSSCTNGALTTHPAAFRGVRYARLPRQTQRLTPCGGMRGICACSGLQRLRRGDGLRRRLLYRQGPHAQRLSPVEGHHLRQQQTSRSDRKFKSASKHCGMTFNGSRAATFANASALQPNCPHAVLDDQQSGATMTKHGAG